MSDLFDDSDKDLDIQLSQIDPTSESRSVAILIGFRLLRKRVRELENLVTPKDPNHVGMSMLIQDYKARRRLQWIIVGALVTALSGPTHIQIINFDGQGLFD